MATQRGLVVEKAGAPFKVVDTLPRSQPGPKQALTLFVAINPVELFMQQTALLTTGLPAVLGSDFSGLVLEGGSGCERLSKGDYVYASCNLGQNAFSPFQETFLVDEASVFKKSANLSVEESAGIGVGILTAAFGLFVGAKIPLPAERAAVPVRDEWIVILGGSGTVGHYAVQIARACGFKVAASCSPAKASRVAASGANASFSNRDSPHDQAARVKAVTGGKFTVVFDTSAQADQAAFTMLEQSGEETKTFATTDSVNNYTVPAGVVEYRVSIGMLGRGSDIGRHITRETAGLVPVLEGLVAEGAVRPVECELFDESGWEALIDGLKYYAEGKAAKKLVVCVQE